MATIAKLCEDNVIVPLTVRLSRREQAERRIFVYPGVTKWLDDVLPDLKQIEPSNLSPREQLLSLLQHYIAGRPMTTTRMFRRMRPLTQDVFELKTPDLRIFGWFHQKDNFIAVAIDQMEKIKKHDLYTGYLGMVVRERGLLDLDQPKCLWGAKEADVVSV